MGKQAGKQQQQKQRARVFYRDGVECFAVAPPDRCNCGCRNFWYQAGGYAWAEGCECKRCGEFHVPQWSPPMEIAP